MSTERFGHTASLLEDGLVLVVGGQKQRGILNFSEIYNPATGSFTLSGAMVDARKDHTATILSNGKVLITGGDDNREALFSAELFDPATGTFAETGSMFAPRTFHTATLLKNGRVLILGGSPAFDSADGVPVGAIDSAEFFEPKTRQFVAVATSMTTPRTEHTATLLQGGRKVLITGGVDNNGLVLSSAEIFDTTTGTFTPTDTMITPRMNHTATLLKDGTVLIAGGFDNNGDSLDIAEIYDPVSGTFAQTNGDMNAPRAFQTASLLPNGQVLLAGGNDDNSAEVYDPPSGFFAPLTAGMLAARDFQSATTLGNGQILMAGGATCCVVNQGFPSAASSPSAELFDATSGTFVVTGTMQRPRSFHTATLLHDGTVLIAGGEDTTSIVSNTAELYDPASGVFSLTGSLINARFFHSAAVLACAPSIAGTPACHVPPGLNGDVLVAGGGDSTGIADQATAELYTPAASTFASTGSLGTARDNATATVLNDGRVLIAGGEDTLNGNPLSSAEIYDPSTGTFTTVASAMTMPRRFHAASLLQNGTVLITGGVITSPVLNRFTETAEIFDPNGNGGAGSFTATGSMNEQRAFHTSTLLSDGRVLVAGGTGDSSAETYDPSIGQFSFTDDMIGIRFSQTATLLDSGMVLIAGGDLINIFGEDIAQASAELFDPSGDSGVGTFTSIGDMTTARTGHTATLLSDGSGRVLITGGLGTNTTLGSAELFTPKP
jgi:WD40 repeat protein